MAPRTYGQYCGVVTALELVGERWALLIVRDLLVGPRRYSDLKAGLPRIPTNILATRLKELQAAGVVRRVPLAHGLVYDLTDYGRGLEEVVLALGRWGFRAMGEPGADEIVTPDSMTTAFRTAFRPSAAAGWGCTVVVHVGDVVLTLAVDDGELTVARGAADHATLTLAAGPAIREVIAGEVSPEEAVRTGVVHVLDGDPTALGRFAEIFHLEAEPAPVVVPA